MGVLEGLALGMQYLFLGMFFVFGAVVYSVGVFCLVDEENREKWLLPIPLAFGLAVLLILPALLGWVGWVLYFVCIGAWTAVVVWQHPTSRDAVWGTLVWLWEKIEPVIMPKRFAAKVAKAEAEERAELEAKEAQERHWQALRDAEEREEERKIREIRKHNQRLREQQLREAKECEASGDAERERKAKEETARKAEAKRKAEAEAEEQRKAKAEAKAEAERKAKATQAAEDEDGFPMF